MAILKRIKNLAFLFASLNIMFSPLAVSAQAESNNVAAAKEFLKTSGLNKGNITVGEYYRNISKDLSPEVIAKINPYFLLYQDEMMPSVDPITFKDKNNVEQVRMAVTFGGKTYSFQTEGSDDKIKLKMNSFTSDNKPWENPEALMEGLAREAGIKPGKNPVARTILDLKLAPTKLEWKNFSFEQQIQFLIMTRHLIEDIQKVLPVSIKSESAKNEDTRPVDKFALVFELLNPEACAGKPGKNGPKGKNQASGRCIVAGYVTEYGKNGSCGGRPDGRLDLDSQQNSVKPGLSSKCQSGKGVSCNPLFYGYQDSGSPYCVTGSASAATEQCNGQSKLRRDGNEVDDIKKIISSFLKDKTGRGLKSAKKNAKGDIEVETESVADYDVVRQQLDALDKTFRDALDICEAGDKNVSMDSRINKPSNLMNTKADQKSACNAIVKRYIAVQQLQLAPTNPAPPAKDIAKEIPERETGCPIKDGNCACSADGERVGGPVKPKCGGLEVTPSSERSIAVEEAPVKEKDSFCFNRDDDGSKRLNATCGLLGLAAIFGAGWAWIKSGDKKKKAKQKRYDPAPSPVTVPATGTTNPPTTTAPVVPIVENPPIAPIPTAETPTTSTPSTTPTDSGTIRKVTPGTR